MSTVAEMPAETTLETPTLDVSELESIGAGRILRRLSENCMAIKVEAHSIGQERQIKQADVTIEGDKPPEGSVKPPRWSLVPGDIRSKTQSVISRARTLPSLYGTPFPGGAYIVPVTAGQSRRPAAELLSSIRAHREELTQAVLDLRPKWDLWREEQQQKMTESQWNQYGKHLVDGDTFVAKHSISAIIFPMGGSGLPTNFADPLQARLRRLLENPDVASADYEAMMRLFPEIVQAVQEVASSPAALLTENSAATWIVEAKRATDQAIAESVRQMIQEPMTEFANALANMEGIIRRDSNIQARSLDPVRRAYNKLTGFSFLLPRDMQDRLTEISSRLSGVTPQTVNGPGNREAAGALADFLRDASQEMASEDAHVQNYGQFMRSLDV